MTYFLKNSLRSIIQNRCISFFRNIFSNIMVMCVLNLPVSRPTFYFFMLACIQAWISPPSYMLAHTFLCILFITKILYIYFSHLRETILALQIWHVFLLLAVILPGESEREEIRAIALFTSPIVFCSPVLLFGKKKLRHSGAQSKSGRGEMRRRYHCWYSTNWFCKVTHKTSLVTLPFPPSHNPPHLLCFYLSSLFVQSPFAPFHPPSLSLFLHSPVRHS